MAHLQTYVRWCFFIFAFWGNLCSVTIIIVTDNEFSFVPFGYDGSGIVLAIFWPSRAFSNHPLFAFLAFVMISRESVACNSLTCKINIWTQRLLWYQWLKMPIYHLNNDTSGWKLHRFAIQWLILLLNTKFKGSEHGHFPVNKSKRCQNYIISSCVQSWSGVFLLNPLITKAIEFFRPYANVLRE